MYKYRRREALKLRDIRNFRDPVTVRHKCDHRVLRIEEFGVERIGFALLNQLPTGMKQLIRHVPFIRAVREYLGTLRSIGCQNALYVLPHDTTHKFSHPTFYHLTPPTNSHTLHSTRYHTPIRTPYILPRDTVHIFAHPTFYRILPHTHPHTPYPAT